MRNSKIFSGEIVSEREFILITQDEFLTYARILYPHIFEDIYVSSFKLLRQSGMYEALNPIKQPDFNWKEFEKGLNLTSERNQLREILLDWQLKNNLIENDGERKWVLYWLIRYLSKFRGLKKFKDRHGISNVSRTQRLTLINLAQEKINLERITPPLNFQTYKPYEQTREKYLEDLKIKGFINAIIEKDSVLSKSSVRKRNYFVNHIAENIRAEILPYCKKIEELFLSTKWIEHYFEENASTENLKSNGELIKDRWIKTPDYENYFRDLLWTIRSTFGKMSYSEISKKGKILEAMEYKRKVIKYEELTEDHFVVSEMDRSTIKRSIEKMLKAINLKPIKEKGRPKGKKDNSKILRNLGK